MAGGADCYYLHHRYQEHQYQDHQGDSLDLLLPPGADHSYSSSHEVWYMARASYTGTLAGLQGNPECEELGKQINAATGIEDGKGMQCIQPPTSRGYVAPYV